MKNSLAAPPGLEDMTDSQAVLAAAQRHLENHPIEIGNSNCGPWVRLYCHGNDGANWYWCAGYVSLIMQQAYFFQTQKTTY